MAWVSPRIIEFLSKSEEGKDIIQKLPEMSQEDAVKEIEAFFAEGGKGFESAEAYLKAKEDDANDESNYEGIMSAEISEEEYKKEE